MSKVKTTEVKVDIRKGQKVRVITGNKSSHNLSVERVGSAEADEITKHELRRPVRIHGKIRDQSKGKDVFLPVTVDICNDGILIGAKGFGEKTAMAGDACPIVIEFYKGKLRVCVWGDINQEDATHVIDMSNAQEKLFKEDA